MSFNVFLFLSFFIFLQFHVMWDRFTLLLGLKLFILNKFPFSVGNNVILNCTD